jgi:hypothetical protein
MSEYYTKAQIDAQAAVIGARVKTRSSAAHILARIDETPDVNLISDAERSAIATIEPTKFKGTYATLGAIPTAGAAAGMYAILTKAGDDTIAVWDVGAGAWVDTGNAVTAETAATIKTKYESNANTNAFTDAEKNKLAAISDAANITAFTAALDAALA